MAVTFDNSAITVQTTTAACVVTLVVAADANCLVAALYDHNGTSISACLANGTPMTYQGMTIHNSNSCSVALYTLMNPPTGTISISAATVGGVAPTFGMAVASYKNVTSIGNTAQQTGSVQTNAVVNFNNTTANGMVVCAGVGRGNTMTAMNATKRQGDTVHMAVYLVDSPTTGTNYSLSWSIASTSNNESFFGVTLLFTVASTTTTNGLALMGCGT